MSPEYTPESLLAMGRGFMESRILLTGAELDLFTMLAPAPLLAQDLAEWTGFHLRPLTVLLDALTAMGLLIKKDARYQTEPSVAPFLSSDAPGSVLPMVLHGAGLWKTWSQLTTIVSEAVGPERPAAAFRSQDDLKAFIGAMAAVGAPMARSIAAAADPGRAKYLLDVGGATGTYTLAFLEANPDLKATIFREVGIGEYPWTFELYDDHNGSNSKTGNYVSWTFHNRVSWSGEELVGAYVDNDNLLIRVTGDADDPPICQVTPTTLYFDVDYVDETDSETFKIKNVGGGTLSGSVLESCYEFTLNTSDYSLGPGEEKPTHRRRPDLTSAIWIWPRG